GAALRRLPSFPTRRSSDLQAGQHAVDDRRADLALDVVPHDRQLALREAPGPVRLRGDEDRDAVDERAARVQDLLDVPLRRHLRADRKSTRLNSSHVSISYA